MQPHFWIVAIGRTWWAHSSMAENRARMKVENSARTAKEKTRSCQVLEESPLRLFEIPKKRAQMRSCPGADAAKRAKASRSLAGSRRYSIGCCLKGTWTMTTDDCATSQTGGNGPRNLSTRTGLHGHERHVRRGGRDRKHCHDPRGDGRRREPDRHRRFLRHGP